MNSRGAIAGIVALLTVVSALAIMPAAVPATAAESEDVLYVAMQEDLPDFNNYNIGSNSVWKANVLNFFYETLALTDYDLKSQPQLAESWVFYESALKVEVKLREGVHFHDGTEMTSADVVYSYLMARNGTTYSDRIVQSFDIDDNGTVEQSELNIGVKANGTYRVTLTMARPYGQFFSSGFAVPIVPKHIWQNHVNTQSTTLEWGNQVDVQWSAPEALIGTGSYMYDSGVQNSYRIIKAFHDVSTPSGVVSYWGKDFYGPGQHYKTPAGYPLYPLVLDKVHYKIYASIDTAILALQAGDVDYIAWAVTPGRVPALQSDPNIELEYMSDAGYFYLAFNMKKEPMNNLTYRRAISHLIDKDQIVDVYMAGFGQAGSAAVPPFFGEWHNPAVTKYPYDPALAKSMLDAAGYTDKNGDGWRELPDGRLMEKITLLCPPADYDPIRIRAGQMLATNMREAGINVEAKPIDFNTLVAKMTAFDYQMLELGWIFTGYTECVSVLYDTYGLKSSGNSWAFWSETTPNPLYSSLGGVSTLADAATQKYADDFWALENLARANFTTAGQIAYTKAGQEIIADAVPCNVLYYRVNVEAHNKLWQNWTVFDGRLINGFSWMVLDHAGKARTEVGGKVATLDVGITVAEKIQSNEKTTATVIAIDNEGAPVANAAITVLASGGAATVSPLSGTTNAAGLFTFEVTGAGIGVANILVNATSGALKANDTASVRVTSLGGIGCVLTPGKTVVSPGESISVIAKVTNVKGDPVQGATVTIDPYLLGYGTINPSSAVTDATGEAAMTYTAPAAMANTHLMVQLAATVTHPWYALSNLAANGIIVRNTDKPDWTLTTIESVSEMAMHAGANSTSILVKATDALGNPIVGEGLNVTYSNESLVYLPTKSIFTDASGNAVLPVTIRDELANTALKVTIGNKTKAGSLSESVVLTYSRTGALNGLYGGYVTYETTKYIDALASLNLTFHVFDSWGDPADGVNASVVVAASAYGQMTDWPGSAYNSLTDYAGVAIMTTADEQNLVTAGSFNITYPDWGFNGTVINGGMYNMTITGVDLAQLDQALDVFLCPDATGTYSMDTFNYEIHGMTTLSTQYGYNRTDGMASVIFDIDKPVLAAKGSEFDMTNLVVTAYDENNDALDGADVAIYQRISSGGTILSNVDYWIQPSDDVGVPTVQTVGANGTAHYSAAAAAWDGTEFAGVVRATNPNIFVRATMDGKFKVMSQTQLVVEPLRESVFVNPDAKTSVSMIGDTVYVTVTVLDKAKAPYAGLPVSISAGIGAVKTPTVVTDADGKATFAIDTSGIDDSAGALLVATVSTGGTPEAGTAKVSVALQNLPPEIVMSSPEDGGEFEGPDALITGTIYDTNGIATATLEIDGGSPINLAPAGKIGVSISEAIEGLEAGDHTLTVNATDSLGISTEVDVDFTVVEKATTDTTMPWIAAGIGWIVAAALLVMLLMKKRKSPAAAPMEQAPAADEPKL